MVHTGRQTIQTCTQTHRKNGYYPKRNVQEIERFIRKIKERAWAIVNTLPIEQYPNRLIVETVYNTIFWLNCFPHKNGIHPTLSPCTIITGSTIDYNKHCTLQFGSYVQVHNPHNNSLLPGTTGALPYSRPAMHRAGTVL